jgi:DnaJ-class molecular chaperone
MMRCQPCNGSKVIKPLGNMEKRCPTCDGVGYVETANDSANEIPVIDDTKHKKTSKEAIQQRLSEARANRKAKKIV